MEIIKQFDCKWLVRAFVEGRDYQDVARDLGIARQMARNIVVNFRTTGRVDWRPRGGAWQEKIDSQIVDYLMEKIKCKATSTLKDLHDQMWVDMRGKPAVSYQAISKKLDGLMYTVKDIRGVPVQWNTLEIRWSSGSLLTG